MNWDEAAEFFRKSEFAPTRLPNDVTFYWDMDRDLMLLLVQLRRAADNETLNRVRFVIKPNGGFALGPGHSKTSLHGNYLVNTGLSFYGVSWLEHLDRRHIGKAVDFTIEEHIGGKWVPWSWLKQAAFVYPYLTEANGLGIYPWWKRPGLHLDNRTFHSDRSPAVWFRNAAGAYTYRPFGLFYDLVDEIRRIEA